MFEGRTQKQVQKTLKGPFLGDSVWWAVQPGRAVYVDGRIERLSSNFLNSRPSPREFSVGISPWPHVSVLSVAASCFGGLLRVEVLFYVVPLRVSTSCSRSRVIVLGVFEITKRVGMKWRSENHAVSVFDDGDVGTV